MKVTAAQILRPVFLPALNSLLKRKLDMPQCVAIAEATTKIEEHLKTVNKIRKGLIDKYVEKDDKGQPRWLNQEAGEPLYISEEAAEAFEKESLALMKTEFDVEFDESMKVVLTNEDQMEPQFYRALSGFVKYDPNAKK